DLHPLLVAADGFLQVVGGRHHVVRGVVGAPVGQLLDDDDQAAHGAGGTQVAGEARSVTKPGREWRPVATPRRCPMPQSVRLRDARLDDIPALVALEALFPTDRMPERQFRHPLLRGKGRLRVAVAGARLRAYAVVMFRRGSTVARLYSISVDPAARGQGLGARLLADAERGARARGCDRLRLEVRVHNR